MADYGAQDTSTTNLGANQFPISEAWTPNAGFSAVEGGPQSTDAGGKKSAPVSVYAKDGSNVTQGAQADAAYTDGTGAASGTGMGLFKGIFVKLAAIAGSVAGTLKVKGDILEVPFSTTTAQVVASTDAANYRWVEVIVTSQGTSSTITFQASGNNSNYVSTALQSINSQTGSATALTSVATGIWHGPLGARYFQLNVTGISAGTTAGIVRFHTLPSALPSMTVSASQNGAWTVQPGNTQNTTPWMVSTAGLPTGLPSFVIKEVKSVSVTAGTGLSIWTPQSGKKFRLIGWDLAPVTASSQAGIQFQDTVTYNTANEFLRVPRFLSVNWTPTPRSIGPNGYLSTAANNQLWIDVTVTTNVEGYVYGFEE